MTAASCAYCLFIFAVLGTEARDSLMQSEHSATHSQPSFYAIVCFCCKDGGSLFAEADLKLLGSSSAPASACQNLRLPMCDTKTSSQPFLIHPWQHWAAKMQGFRKSLVACSCSSLSPEG